MKPAAAALAAEGALVWLTAGALFLSANGLVEATLDHAKVGGLEPAGIVTDLDWITPIGPWLLGQATLIALAYVLAARRAGGSLLRLIAWALACFAAIGSLAAVSYWAERHLLLDGPRPISTQRVIGNQALATAAAVACWIGWRRQRTPTSAASR